MNASSKLNFSHKNLRNQSFKGQNLNYADFSKTDIRGCDFSQASLQGANFQGVIAGQSLTKLLVSIFFSIIIFVLTFHSHSQMIFAVLGLTPENSTWSYSVALFTSLGVAGIAVAIRATIIPSILQRIATIISTAASSALLGFFYGGTAFGVENPQVAVTSALISAVSMATISLYYTQGLVPILITVAGTVAAYGFTFMMVTVASAFLSTQNLVKGIIWVVLSLGSIVATIITLKQTIREITLFGTTSFRGADLTNANFDKAKLSNTDFSGAIKDF